MSRRNKTTAETDTQTRDLRARDDEQRASAVLTLRAWLLIQESGPHHCPAETDIMTLLNKSVEQARVLIAKERHEPTAASAATSDPRMADG